MSKTLEGDELRALSAAATPGPWAPWGDPGSYVHIWTADERIVARDTPPADAEFIVWCRNHADALADLIDAARYIRTTGHGEKLTDMTTCRCGDPHPCPVLRTHDAIADLIEWANDAPHHDGCNARHNGSPQPAAARPYPCKCGRYAALAALEADRG